MKHYSYFVFIFLIAFVAKAQRNYDAFDVLENETVVPPNGIRLKDSLFLDDSEVMNSNYLEYLHFLVQDSAASRLISAYPDTSIFGTKHLEKLLKHKKDYYKKKRGKHLPVSTLVHDSIVLHPSSSKRHWWNYFSYHGTRHSPVVGISYEQALAYCKWRSVFVTQHFNDLLKKKKKYKFLEGKEVHFEFSLPSESVWELAASGGLSLEEYPYGQKSIFGKDSVLIVNVLEKKNTKEPQFIYGNPPNALGFYNMIGNAAEMVKEKGRSKGGSYLTELGKCQVSDFLPYKKAEKWLGFRCACIVRIKEMPK